MILIRAQITMEQILRPCAWHTGSTPLSVNEHFLGKRTDLSRLWQEAGAAAWGPSAWLGGMQDLQPQHRRARLQREPLTPAGRMLGMQPLLHAPHVSMTAGAPGRLLKHKIRSEPVVGFPPALRQRVLQTKFEKENEDEMLPHLRSHPSSLPSYSGSTFQRAVCSTALQTSCGNPHAGLCTGTSSRHHRRPSSPSQVEQAGSCMGDGSTCRGQRTVKLHKKCTISIFPPVPRALDHALPCHTSPHPSVSPRECARRIHVLTRSKANTNCWVLTSLAFLFVSRLNGLRLLMQLHWEILQTLDPERPHFIQLLQLQMAAPSQSVRAGGFKPR